MEFRSFLTGFKEKDLENFRIGLRAADAARPLLTDLLEWKLKRPFEENNIPRYVYSLVV